MTAPPLVLVVEDDPTLRSLFAVMLTEEGYAVKAWMEPAPAAAVAALAPALVLTDFVFAGDRAGMSFLRELAANGATSSIPVIVCTASAWIEADETRRELAELACAVVKKPFDIDELLAAVDTCLTPWRLPAP